MRDENTIAGSGDVLLLRAERETAYKLREVPIFFQGKWSKN